MNVDVQLNEMFCMWSTNYSEIVLTSDLSSCPYIDLQSGLSLTRRCTFIQFSQGQALINARSLALKRTFIHVKHTFTCIVADLAMVEKMLIAVFLFQSVILRDFIFNMHY